MKASLGVLALPNLFKTGICQLFTNETFKNGSKLDLLKVNMKELWYLDLYYQD